MKTRALGIGALCFGMVCGLAASAWAEEPASESRLNELLIENAAIKTMRVRLSHDQQAQQGMITPRGECPQISTYTSASFSGGTYTAQGGMGEGEIAAVSYTLPASMFPLKVTQVECIFAQLDAQVNTTTQWSVLFWDGLPSTGTLVASFNSVDDLLPPIQMEPGTQGVNVVAQVDPADPDQVFIFLPPGATEHTFSVGFRIDQHNNQTANPCFTAPPSESNAFPTTDNTVIGCGSGYGALNFPAENWLFALNCGATGCPPNGGWTRFSGLQADSTFIICLTGCRPRGDWVMRATWDPTNCPPATGACCFGTAGCFLADQSTCTTSGGSWKGPGSVCGTNTGSGFPGCTAPVNQLPTAIAGNDQTVTDTDNSGTELVTVDASASTDPDGFIATYTWTEGALVLQDGPALYQGAFAVGTHNLTLTVTDNLGGMDTDTLTIVVNPGGPVCVADVDDGTGTGTPDGGVTIDDLLYYLSIFNQGLVSADVDDGSGTGTPDGGVTIDDLLYYLARFNAGC
ncbi:MAG: GC-type dockerin domain-anchored protein [Phycisphaerales bacterium]